MSAVVSRERLTAAGSANALELRGVSRLFGALAALTDITLSTTRSATSMSCSMMM